MCVSQVWPDCVVHQKTQKVRNKHRFESNKTLWAFFVVFLIKKEGVHFQPFVCFDPFSERCQSILFQILCVCGVHIIRLLCTADAMLVTQSSCKCDIEQINQL